MSLASEPLSSPPSLSAKPTDAIAYYKSQYELLEAELADFQSSSRELEIELEKDIEASEKRERKLKETVESLGYEVEEWKTKYKQAKAEANTAQNSLQKEVTALRETNRAQQYKLRDIEVANDDYERQARNTTSSLEDLESKYNVAIERAVLLEEEIRTGEQERESLRIDCQRLRDELSDLKVEAHILEGKLKKAETALEERISNFNYSENTAHSPTTTATTSSSAMATPQTKSASSVASEVATPPSPPFSETSNGVPKPINTPTLPRPRVSISESTLPKLQSRTPRHSRGPSIPVNNGLSAPSVAVRKRSAQHSTNLPKSGSLYQIRGLIGKMQKLEQRVQTARSRLPAPVDTPPRSSPRSGSALGQNYISSNVTMRSNRKRSSGSVASSAREMEETPSRIPQGRGSFGLPQSTPSRSMHGDSRPSSRTSMSSRCSISQASSNGVAKSRPDSRQSLTGSRTPLGHYSNNSISESRRPRSSLSNYQPSANMSYIDEGDGDISTPTPRQSISRIDLSMTNIPTPAGLKKRPSGVLSSTSGTGIPTPRRTSTSSTLDRKEGGMLPPDRRRRVTGPGLGETY